MMMTDVTQTESFSAALADVRAKFVDRFFDRIVELESVAETLRTGPAKIESLERVRDIVHKIAGVAPTVGLDGIGRCAADIDLTLSRHLGKSDPQRLWGAIEPSLETLMNDMENELDKTLEQGA